MPNEEPPIANKVVNTIIKINSLPFSLCAK